MFEEFTGQNIMDFMKAFPDDESCKRYLAHYRWKDGYTCSKCGCTEEHHSNREFYKRCKKCNHQESVTSGTLFHKVKFGIKKAFYILFEICTTTKSASSQTYATKYGINHNSAWLFAQKVRKAMESSLLHPLTGKVEVDETLIGAKAPGKRGRGAEKKTLVVIAIEKSKGEQGIKRAYAEVITNASSEELEKMFEKHISQEAQVKTDKWRGYLPIMESWNIEMEKSFGGQNFELMHRFIQGLKSWIRGIYHHVSPEHLQKYLDEYCYRFNRSIFKETIFDKLIQRMVSHPPIFYSSIKLCQAKINR